MGISDLHIVSDVPAGSALVELTIDDLAKRLGLEPIDVPLLARSIEDAVQNLTDHGEFTLGKSNENHDDHGRFATGSGGHDEPVKVGTTAIGSRLAFVNQAIKDHPTGHDMAAHMRTVSDSKLQAALGHMKGHADAATNYVREHITREIARRGTNKNLTVGDVHATTSLKDVTVAYIQGEDDGDEEKNGDEARKGNENHGEHGRFAAGSGGGKVSEHAAALNGAGTDRPKFEAAHAALSSDKSMKLNDLKAVAGQYLHGHIHSSGATRAHVLEQMARDFTANARFHNKIKRDDGEVVFDLAVTKVDPDQRKVFGWASVCAFDGNLVVDKQGDIINVADLEPAAHDFTLYSRTQGDMHTDIGVGRLIESVIFDQAKRDAGIIAKDNQGRVIDGWFVGFLVDDDQVWESHKRGERPEFSIGGRARREEV